MADLDRAGLIDLLNRLGSPDDATVLEAARALHRKADEAGFTWNELIRPDPDDENEATDVDAGKETAREPDPGSAEIARLIDRITRKGVSDTLRSDLAEMKSHIAEGTLDAMDARYVRALARRLGI